MFPPITRSADVGPRTVGRIPRMRLAEMVFLGVAALTPGSCGATVQDSQGLVEVDGGHLFYETVGNGDPILVIHGGPGLDHRYLRPGLDILARSHRLIYYDQRGTGRSDVMVDSAHISLKRFLADIEAIRTTLGYERITVLGHSFGGLLALAYARAHRENTSTLILLDAPEPGKRFATETVRRQLAARTPTDSAEIANAMADPGFMRRDPAVMSTIYRAAFRGTMRSPERVNELDLDLAETTARNGPDVARLLGASMTEELDGWSHLREVRVPALVLQGRWDLPPQAMGEALAKAMPFGRFVALDGGHFPFIEDPQGLAEAVSVFLASISPSGTS